MQVGEVYGVVKHRNVHEAHSRRSVRPIQRDIDVSNTSGLNGLWTMASATNKGRQEIYRPPSHNKEPTMQVEDVRTVIRVAKSSSS